jgi:hypothetical protein
MEELDGPAIRVLGLRSQQLSNFRKTQSSESLSQHDESMLYRPLSGIRAYPSSVFQSLLSPRKEDLAKWYVSIFIIIELSCISAKHMSKQRVTLRCTLNIGIIRTLQASVSQDLLINRLGTRHQRWVSIAPAPYHATKYLNNPVKRTYLSLIPLHTYIPLTLYPRRGSRGISDILPRCPRFTKII